MVIVRIRHGIEVPRFAWHRPPWDYPRDRGLRSYQPARTAYLSGEANAIARAAGGWETLRRRGVIWLAPEYRGDPLITWGPYARNGSARVDLAALDLRRLVYTYGAEGYVWHFGDIPAQAIVAWSDNDPMEDTSCT